MKKKTKPTDPYPNITALGLTVVRSESDQYEYVPNKDLTQALVQKGIKKQFGEFYGCQTQCSGGPYACDVEATLERINTGKLTGTQSAAGWD